MLGTVYLMNNVFVGHDSSLIKVFLIFFFLSGPLISAFCFYYPSLVPIFIRPQPFSFFLFLLVLFFFIILMIITASSLSNYFPSLTLRPYQSKVILILVSSFCFISFASYLNRDYFKYVFLRMFTEPDGKDRVCSLFFTHFNSTLYNDENKEIEVFCHFNEDKRTNRLKSISLKKDSHIVITSHEDLSLLSENKLLIHLQEVLSSYNASVEIHTSHLKHESDLKSISIAIELSSLGDEQIIDILRSPWRFVSDARRLQSENSNMPQRNDVVSRDFREISLIANIRKNYLNLGHSAEHVNNIISIYLDALEGEDVDVRIESLKRIEMSSRDKKNQFE
jgi:hypothetical protein